MRVSRLVVAGFMLVTLTAVLVTRSGASKVKQCNKLIGGINGLDLTLPQGDNAKSIGELAARAENGATDLGRVALSDPELSSFRERYRTNLAAFAQSNRKVAATLAEYKGLDPSRVPPEKIREMRDGLEALRAQIEQQVKASNQLTAELNRYCSGP